MRPAFDHHVLGDALPDALRPYVREVYELGLDMPPGEPLRTPVSATTDPALNVSLSSPITVDIGRGFVLPPVTIAGPQREAYAVEMTGRYRGFYVRFAPTGPLVLLGVEDYALTPAGARPLHEMVPPPLAGAAHDWSDALFAAAGFEERLALTTAFLLAHRREPDRRARTLAAAVEAIEAAGGDVRIADLADDLGVGASTLRRDFVALGVSPKRFAAIVRFRQAHAFLHTTPGATWTDAVARFGYADQAHFVREYRRFSGEPPTRWDPQLRGVDLRLGIETPTDGPD